MSPEDRAALRSQLILHEGLRLKPYVDTVGKVTIGIGRNLTDNGISLPEALAMLDTDIRIALDALNAYEWFHGLDPVRQRVVIDLMFNLGAHRFGSFRQMIAALHRGDYYAAASELIDSRWFTQVGERGPRLVSMLRSGRDVS